MSATRDGKMWRCQFYYKDWQGVSHKKNKRGFKTKAEAEQWERDFLQQQQRNLDINFENFVQIYYEDMEHRLRENTMRTKKFIIDLKIIPYFKKKNMNEIKASDIRAWQNALMKRGYSETYLKTVNNQLSAIFNYAVRYYDLKDNPCRKAGSIGKSHAGEKEFWTKQEFKQFLVTVENKPETKMAFLLLYWTGMRIGELLAITYNDIDLEKRTISVNKSYQRIEGRDIITPPKTPKSKRIITIPPFLTEELKEYISHLYGIMADERMFRFTKSYMEHEIIRGIKASGVKRIRLHDIRHSHASLLISMGENPLLIKERLGHEKIQTTLGTYGHLYPNSNLEVANKLTGVLTYTPASHSIADYTSNQHTAIYHREVE
ncbi:putative prophage phiRv2 integrase [Clostridiales bacterium]|nr:putative prophage phiRv2 integrase [Clostridiales bacterium]